MRGAVSKKSAEGESKGKVNSQQSQKLMPGAPAPDHKCNKNGKHRNGKQRRKSKTERKRTHANRTRLSLLVQDKKAETKEGGFRKQANHTENKGSSLSARHILRRFHNYLPCPCANLSYSPSLANKHLIHSYFRSSLKLNPDPSGHVDLSRIRISYHLGIFNINPTDSFENTFTISLENYHEFTKEQMLTARPSRHS